MPDESRRRARDRVLLQLKTRGEQTAAQLAKRLDITPYGARQHLAALEDEGLVSRTERREKVGRPAHLWRVTEAAGAHFPDTHADLTVELLESMEEAFGDEGLGRLLAARARRQRSVYRARMPAADAPLGRRLAALARLRREEGYMAESRRQPDGSYLLVENHCPICAAAKVCQGLCRDELELFREVLGRDVTVEREEHLLAGARRCAYRVAPRD